MATVIYIPEHKQHLSAMRAVIAYCQREDKVWDEQSGRSLISGIHCDGFNAVTEFEATKAAYHKLDGMNFYQYVQSFSPKEPITPVQAHEIAKEFAEKAWPGHEVLVTTHCDAAHVHSHFVINSVSFENGKKLRQDPGTLKKLRQLSDEICQAQGLSVLKPYQSGGQNLSAREYRTAKRGESWKFRLMYHIGKAMEQTIAQYVRLLKDHNEQTMNSIQASLRQAGSEREQHSTAISKMLSDSLKAMEATATELNRRVKKLFTITVAASLVASVLVCVVWQWLLR